MSNNMTASQPTHARLRDGYLTTDERRRELLLAPTGLFRPIIEEYLATAGTTYTGERCTRVRGSLSKFFRFVVTQEHLENMYQIHPSTITRFILAERERGIRNRIVVGHLSTFFDWLIVDKHHDFGNPVVPRMHWALMGEPPSKRINRGRLTGRRAEENVQ